MCGCITELECPEVPDGEDPVLMATGESSAISTLLVQSEVGPSSIISRRIRALKDATATASTCLTHTGLLSGGGAVEARLYGMLMDHISEHGGGLEARVLEAWGDALLSIPTTLAENAGVNPARTQAELLALHARGMIHHGVSLGGEPMCMLKAGVVEPLWTKTMILQHATEMANCLIKVHGGPVQVSD